ncbi:MAG: ribosome silencing factor [Ruminococcus sp.]|nr:ribosome silencing factor [Ruminococcus sp.]
MKNDQTNEKLRCIISALDSKRAENIKAIGIKDLTIIADYFVIANGDSTTQTKALADEVEYQMKQKFGIDPNHTEGYSASNWIVLDYQDIVVHVFYTQEREHYNLERLWADGEEIDISPFVVKE